VAYVGQNLLRDRCQVRHVVADAEIANDWKTNPAHRKARPNVANAHYI